MLVRLESPASQSPAGNYACTSRGQFGELFTEWSIGGIKYDLGLSTPGVADTPAYHIDANEPVVGFAKKSLGFGWKGLWYICGSTKSHVMGDKPELVAKTKNNIANIREDAGKIGSSLIDRQE
jgi:hypothetical protein